MDKILQPSPFCERSVEGYLLAGAAGASVITVGIALLIALTAKKVGAIVILGGVAIGAVVGMGTHYYLCKKKNLKAL